MRDDVAFKTLGIKPTYDNNAIRRAYVAAAKANHPDTGGSAVAMAAITEAYEQLNDVSKHRNKKMYCTLSVDLLNFLRGGNLIAEVILNGVPTVIEFDMPPYTHPGSQIKISKKNLTGTTIYATLNDIESSAYRRIEGKIVITETISKLEAETGTTVNVINYDGITHAVNIPAETTASRLIYIIPLSGFFTEKSNARDELIIVIEIE